MLDVQCDDIGPPVPKDAELLIEYWRTNIARFSSCGSRLLLRPAPNKSLPPPAHDTARTIAAAAAAAAADAAVATATANTSTTEGRLPNKS